MLRARAWIVGALALAPVLIAEAAEPARPVVRFTYVRDMGAEACPAREEFEAMVAARLGYLPFREDADRSLNARFSRRGPRLVAEVVGVGTDDAPRRRELSSSTRDCDELARAVALAVSVAIDPFSLTRDPSQPASSSALPSASAAPAPPSSPALSTPRAASARPAPSTVAPTDPGPDRRLRPSVGVFAHAAFAQLPQASLGLGLELGLRRRAWQFELGARWLRPVEAAFSVGDTRSNWFGGVLGACYAWTLTNCALLAAGRLSADGGGVSEPRSDATWTFGAGLGVAWELPLGGVFSLGARGEGWINPRRVTLLLSETELWTSPLLAANLGVTLGARLP